MDQRFWLEQWVNSRTGFHQCSVNQFLERHGSSAFPHKTGSVLVPLCGKSLDMHYLQQAGHHVVGVELSPLAVDQFFKESNLNPAHHQHGDLAFMETNGITIIQGDFFKLQKNHLPEIVAVYDRAALIAIPPDQQSTYVNHLLTLISSDATLLLITLDYDSREMQGPPFSTPPEQVESLFGSQYSCQIVESVDALNSNPVFASRGLTRLRESVWILKKIQSNCD